MAIGFPGTRAQRAFDKHLGAFLEVLAGDLTQFREAHYIVPLRAFLIVAGRFVTPGFAGRDAKISHGIAVLHIAGFRVSAQIANEDHLVDASCHGSLPLASVGPYIQVPSV